MSEEVIPPNVPKQYMLIVDEIGMALLMRVIPSIQYIEIVSIPLSDTKDHVLLAHPVPKKEEANDKT